ncbi:hypothetical protein Ahy_A07g033931 isoform A [Arachis hypogaea]|uniref:DYW domain-containing protein n=1 Tax=Arachis hypogaea TaxID=3818 RepID=A0A445CAH0_ARAHY|nr:hypothetical protein Ahy_A07g033931 isoform A [Arachis hypogaea]
MSHVFYLSPTIEHSGCMVDLLSRAVLLVEAHNLIKSMPMKLNTIVLRELLGGCRLHHDTKLAEPNSGHYVLLSNIYSASHRWDEAEKVRLTLNEKGMQKLPGCSWVEVDGVVHEYFVGDTFHPMSPKIYEKLECLFKELREVGYSPTTEFVLFDIEEKEKKYFLGCHSEKLAVAFALINTGANDIICVIKNLRIWFMFLWRLLCTECIEVFKIIVGANWVLGFVGRTFYADITPVELAAKNGLS